MSLSITADTSEQQRMERFAEMLFRVRRNTTAPLPKSEAEAVERVSEEMRHTLGVIATPGATAEPRASCSTPLPTVCPTTAPRHNATPRDARNISTVS